MLLPLRVLKGYPRTVLPMVCWLFSLLLFLPAQVHAQNDLDRRISIVVKDQNVEDVLKKIEKLVGVKFIYSREIIQSKQKISYQAQNQPIQTVLNEILNPIQITYESAGNQILLKRITPPASTLKKETVLGAEIPVTGTVTDEKGNPVAGVNILIKGTTRGTVTTSDGTFKVLVNSEEDELLFSFLGYKTQEVRVGKQSSINLTLRDDNKVLDEVVVVGFGLKNKKETVSGAISTVNAEELSHASTVTAAGALVGKIPGIAFRQTTGRPGSAPAIEIRNYGTPLVIIDGIQKDYGSFAQLDFNDIENISILKDASASIYGMQAANGVLVVTTKKGKRNQKPTITLQSYYGLQIPAGYNKPADAATYMKAIVQDETYNNVPDAARTINREQYDKWVRGTEPGFQSFDWYNYIWQTRPQIYGSLNVSGGSDNADYYISLNRVEQKSMLRNFHGFDRTNFQSNVNFNITKKLKVGVLMNGRLERNRQPGLPGDDYDFALQAAFRNLPTKRPFVNDDPRYPGISAIDPQFSYGWINEEMSGKYESQIRIMQINGTAEYSIFDGLKARALVSYWYRNIRNDLREKSPLLYRFDQPTNAYTIAYQGNARYLERNVENAEEMTSNVQLDYEKTFAKHHVHLVTGMETKLANYSRVYIWGNQEANGIPFLTTKSTANVIDAIPFNQSRLGVLGRFNYDYDNKYILELSGRYDGSYFYKKGKRFGFFPSGSLAYRISQEGFWKTILF
ncbi:hypothetical protein BWI93_17775 [Siphonobacter sp. BAB-5385]|uniref:SusC/RagA family TonB-linked outer membrane protein n=1 Tax=Siphonobacter sp. BAB-5385 TaxID=1864822 RepID=UPI000B9E039F|nr:SusC/RagA family TonB-linked outer membrane protein [Siphonobacter sp. BAB-5385]OZI06847.1 hypothetical protein BWI93_17775 [Siphonobacter sp. BAB-5385]